jgi:hypothetical protein
MITRGFYSVEANEKDPSWFHKHISEMSSLVKPFDYNFIDQNKTIADALNMMKEKNVDCLLSFENGYKKIRSYCLRCLNLLVFKIIKTCCYKKEYNG